MAGIASLHEFKPGSKAAVGEFDHDAIAITQPAMALRISRAL
jgi:hypothetical protein